VVKAALLTRTGPLEERKAHLTLAAYYGRSHRPDSVRERFLHFVAGEAWRDASQILIRQEKTLLSLGYSDPLRNALRHLTLAMPRGAPRVRALRVEAAILRLHSEYAESILSLRRAFVEAEGDSKTEADCLLLIVELYVRMRQIEEAERAFSDARSRGPFPKRLQVFLLLSEARIIEAKGDFPRAQMLFNEAFQLAKRSKVADLAVESVAAWSRLAMLGGEREAALHVVEQGLPDARQAGRLDIVFNLLLVRARVYAETGRKEMAEADMRLIRTEAESLGYLNQLAYTLSGLSAMAIEGGRWAEAVSLARQASSLAERLGNDIVLGHTLAVQATGEHRQGLLEDARAHGERGVAILARLPPSDSLAVARAYLGGIYHDLHLEEAATEQYDEALRLFDSMGMTWWSEALKAEIAAGNQPKEVKG
ncbi:MAG TPA: hypothetical protein VN083_06795, partial [Vicinamibacteria bacterium]|nr:hypothetical protein [Vicinamibacteria bacterium]